MRYMLTYNDRPVGEVNVFRRGLYYDIKCRLKMLNDKRIRLICVSETGESDLGVCVGYGMGQELNRLVPIKSIGSELMKFYLTSNKGYRECYIDENKVFPYIEELESSVVLRDSRGWKIRLL